MGYLYRYIIVFLFISVLVSCKNDKEEEPSPELIETEEPIKQEPTPEQIRMANSVLSKAMLTPELKTFMSALVTTGLTDMLSKEEGPFTVFAPSSEAFDNIPKEKMQRYLSPDNLEEFTQLIKTHIVAGNIDSATLLQSIKGNSGKYDFQSLSGSTLSASLKGDDIVIKDSLGIKATMGKSDITGTNGVVHLLDTVLSIPK